MILADRARPKIYNREELIRYLLNYRYLAQAVNLGRDDRLASRPPPLEEAPWVSVSTVKADIDMALRTLPADLEKIILQAFVFRGNRNPHAVWQGIAEFWGITYEDSKKQAGKALDLLLAALNRQPKEHAY